jgi:transposase
MIRDYQAIQRIWFFKGKQRIIPTLEKHKGVKLLGNPNYDPGHRDCQADDNYEAEVFFNFLRNVLMLYPFDNITIILYNSRIHHAKLLKPLLQKHRERLNLVFLPPYSPNLNLIEGLWRWMKSEIINNIFYDSVKEIQKEVRSFIDSNIKVPDIVIDRLCVQL